MIGKITTHILIAALIIQMLAQNATGNVIREASSTELSVDLREVAVENFTKGLLSFISTEYNTLMNDLLLSLKKILENVIKDAHDYEGVHWKFIQKAVEPFTSFLTELQEIEDDSDIGRKYDLLEGIATTLDAYNSTLAHEPLNDEYLYVEKLLKTHGLESYVNELDHKAEMFKERFKLKSKDIWQKLTAELSDKDENLAIWLENFERDGELLKALESLSTGH